MGLYRTVIAYEDYFEVFLNEQSPKVQAKILQILRVIERLEVIPGNYLKSIKGSDGLFEIRVSFGSDIFRVFCFFDEGKIIVLLSGFKKKSKKTPKKEIEKAKALMKQYYSEKNENNNTVSIGR